MRVCTHLLQGPYIDIDIHMISMRIPCISRCMPQAPGLMPTFSSPRPSVEPQRPVAESSASHLNSPCVVSTSRKGLPRTPGSGFLNQIQSMSGGGSRRSISSSTCILYVCLIDIFYLCIHIYISSTSTYNLYIHLHMSIYDLQELQGALIECPSAA